VQVQKAPGAGQADAMAKILGKQLQEGTKSAVLAKSGATAQRNEVRRERKRKLELTRAKKEARDFDAVGVDGTSIQLEAKLRRIATRGAVALFNAVRKAQKDDEAIVGVSKSMYANKDVKSMDKKDFLGLLASKTAGIHGEPSNKGDAGGSVATGAGAGAGEEGAGEDGSGSGASGGTGQGWSVLQDNYMLESKADDWDKDDASSEEDGSELEDPDDDDDDDEDD